MSASLLNRTSRWRIYAHHSSNPSKAKNVSNWQVWPRGRWGRGDGAAACATEMPEDIGVLPSEAQVLPMLTCDGRPHTTDHQTLSRRLPQAQALEAGHDFLEEIR